MKFNYVLIGKSTYHYAPEQRRDGRTACGMVIIPASGDRVLEALPATTNRRLCQRCRETRFHREVEEVAVSENPVAVVRPRGRHHDVDFGDCLVLYCPGCETIHQPTVRTGPDDPKAALWDWDGSLESPTVSPSILSRGASLEPGTEFVCHSYVRNGKWEFLMDCSHDFAGQTVPLPPLPDWVVEEAKADA